LIASVLEAGGFKVGLLSTVEFQIGEKRLPNDKKMTMLGLGQIQKMLREMVKAGCRYAIVETSSEGILQYRHYGLNYDIAVFTNLGTEHSERHGGFEKLKQDKGKMFAVLNTFHKKINREKIRKVIVANIDDQHSDYYLNFPADDKWGFSLDINKTQGLKSRTVVGKITGNDLGRPRFLVGGEKYNLNIIGDFNVYNALAAVVVGKSQGLSSTQIASGLASVKQVAGRMEFVDCGQAFKVVVDYAHEPLSLIALFKTLRDLVAKDKGKVIAVIGSDGGGRDINKRGKMGKVAGEMVDIVVVTDVNCFDEDPQVIAEMLAVGAREAGKVDGRDLFVVVDRRKGIELAIRLAHPGDVVAITAKGTESCIVVAGGRKIPWDDRAVAKKILQSIK
jgi:UDP-N-acetylmuramoyl-L-alanyl-D-glutamate--2,6-diaminopimelate ligase